MSYFALQLRELIRQVLLPCGLHSDDAEELLFATAAHESYLGKYIHQLGKGPALGMFGMEPNTLKDLYESYLKYYPKYIDYIEKISYVNTYYPWALRTNLAYQIITARLQYRRFPERLPNKNDLLGLANYWKKYWNTYKGAGTVIQFKRNYLKFK